MLFRLRKRKEILVVLTKNLSHSGDSPLIVAPGIVCVKPYEFCWPPLLGVVASRR